MKTLAILIPTYKRFDDLINTLEKTEIKDGVKFVIVANLTDDELSYIIKNFGDKSIVVDERNYGKLGGCKAYNLAYKIAKQNKFDYAILFADDIIPFENNWIGRLYSLFIEKDGDFGIFSTDECHAGHYGWNIILDCPIAHFFIIKCALGELFLETYKQYAIDFEIALRVKEKGIDIQLLPIKLNHLRSGLHREFMDNNMNDDIETLIRTYPKYKTSLKEKQNLFLIKDNNASIYVSRIQHIDLIPWEDLSPKVNFFEALKHKIKSKISNLKLK